jgi:hypothetical protein
VLNFLKVVLNGGKAIGLRCREVLLMSRNKRFNVTLPWGLGEALELWAKREGNKPTTLASFLVESAVRAAIEQGKIPAPALSTEAGDAEPKTVQNLVFRAMAEPAYSEAPNPIEAFAEAALMEPGQVRAILEGSRPTDDDVVALSRMVDWSIEDLTALVRRQYGTNGKHKQPAGR